MITTNLFIGYVMLIITRTAFRVTYRDAQIDLEDEEWNLKASSLGLLAIFGFFTFRYVYVYYFKEKKKLSRFNDIKGKSIDRCLKV